MRSNVQLVIFDLDDTLMLEEPSAVKAFMDVCSQAESFCGVDANTLYETVRPTAREIWRRSPVREYCVKIGISSWEGLWARFEGDDPNLAVLRDWSPYYRQRVWQLALEKCGITDTNLAAELAESFRNGRGNYHVLYDDALECLQQVVEKRPLALITNGVPDLQREKMDATGITGYFREIIVSGEVGFGKPDSRIFQLVLSRSGTEPGFVWSIGDSLERDIKGAQAVGIKAVWLNRRGIPKEGNIIPDLEVANLKEFITSIT